jgi:hypothetical protein
MDRITWIFAVIEVWSRLWPSTVVGRRNYRNTLALVRDFADRMAFDGLPLIVTGEFDSYEKVDRRVFGQAVLYAQVLTTRRNDRVVKVERRAVHGVAGRFDEALRNSEDSSALTTSFIEHLNLTIRQSLAYLARRTLSYARSQEKLEDHLELVRFHYNFVRPHRALWFGRETRTPAMQAELVKRRLTLMGIIVCTRTSVSTLLEYGVFAFGGARSDATDASFHIPLAAKSHLMAEPQPLPKSRFWWARSAS